MTPRKEEWFVTVSLIAAIGTFIWLMYWAVDGKIQNFRNLNARPVRIVNPEDFR